MKLHELLNDLYKLNLTEGTTEVWYHKQFKPVFTSIDVIRIEDLSKSHILLGKISETESDIIFDMMNWNGGEIVVTDYEKKIIEFFEQFQHPAIHTDMSSGDILVIDGDQHVCLSIGWAVV